jgi:hypothetical protein
VFVYNLLDLERFRWEGGVGDDDWLGSSLKAGKHTIVFDFKYSRLPNADGAAFLADGDQGAERPQAAGKTDPRR